MVLILTENRCTVCAGRTMGSKSYWTHSVALLGDGAQVEARLSPFGDSVNLDARKVCGLCRAYHEARKSSWTHPMELLGEWVLCNLIPVHLETVLVSVQYRCMVCAEHTIVLEFILDAPDGTPR
jgi:hypothetical protein